MWVVHLVREALIVPNSSVWNNLLKMGTTGKVPSSSVKAHWVGSIPTGPTKVMASNPGRGADLK